MEKRKSSKGKRFSFILVNILITICRYLFAIALSGVNFLKFNLFGGQLIIDTGKDRQ